MMEKRLENGYNIEIYTERMMQMETGRQHHYKDNGIPPGVPTQKGQTGEPEILGTALPNVPLGNYEVPDGWPTPPHFNQLGDVPGPPVQWEDPEDELAEPGYGYVADTTAERDIYYFHSDHLGSTAYLTDRNGEVTQFVCYTLEGKLRLRGNVSSCDKNTKLVCPNIVNSKGRMFRQSCGHLKSIINLQKTLKKIYTNMNLKSKFHYKVWILGLIIIVTSYVIAKLADYYRLEKQEKKYCYFVSNHGEECVYAINLNDYEYKLIFEKDEEKKNSYVRQLDSIALIYCNWCEEQCSEANSNLGFKEPIVDNARFYKIPLGYCVYLAHPLIPLDNRLIRVDLDTSVFSDGHGYVYYEFLHANPLVSTKPCPITR